MRIVKILITVICFLAVLAGLFLLLISTTQYRPNKTEDIDAQYTKKPPYLLSKKPYYTILSWDIGAAVSGSGTDVFFEGGEMVRPEYDSVQACFSGIKNLLDSIGKVDFVLLQEIDRASKRSYKIKQYAELDSLFSGYASCFAINHALLYYPVPLFKPYGGIVSGMELFSTTFPLESFRYDLGKKKAAFPKKFFVENNCCIINNYRLRNGRSLIVMNVYNGIFGLDEVDQEQLNSLISLIVTEYERGNYVIAGGNWNINPAGYSDTLFTTGDVGFFTTTQLSEQTLPDGWKQYFDPEIPSARRMKTPYIQGKTPVTVVDFFITSPNVQVIETKTIPMGFKYSNHQPVMMEFNLK